MKIITQKGIDSKDTIVVLGLFEEDKNYYKEFNNDLAKELEEVIKKKTYSKKYGEKYSTRVNEKKVYVYGLGKKKELTLEKVRKLLGKAVKCVKCNSEDSFLTNIPFWVREKLDDEKLGRATAEALVLADYKFSKYLAKERKDKCKPLIGVTVQWINSSSKFEKGLKEGVVIAESANITRGLVDESASVCNSVYMERVARSLHPKIQVKVLNEKELKKLEMFSLLGVNAGSNNPPKLVFLEYKGGGKGKYTAIIGKGITFDSGGYNLKPSKFIEDMKIDMAGAAAVMGTLRVAATLGVKRNLVGVMAICENMVSSTAQRPGDIVKAFNGKTIEIGNTDAEGRLVLADAIAYTEKRYKPEIIIDMATLTGACVVALGYYAAAVVGNDDDLLATLKNAGEKAGDRVWPMPFFDEYQDWMDGSISDLNNISQKGKGYEAGSITAGVFLSKFVDKAKWAHIDIAGSAYWLVENGYLGKGATGSGVRVLSYYLMEY
jgi:leucyl aminopeptidase